ncbi:Kinesin- protein 6 [Coelomomyces lativittatus]|nr:Kinesin- protein 6 [Coelomomyces lativittatus]KAJ1515874.1 Kinesin- protein 6 [Coelomomyces lativittatus]KAJ1518157.1 Kinesin- protein 6 [Coelomomyces lativittatus]
MSMLTSTSPIPSLHHKEKETHADDDDDDDDDETTPSLSSSSTLLSSGSETKNSTPHHHAIRIFARIRPSPRVNPKVYVDQPTPNEEGAPQLHFHVPKNESQGQINHTKEHFGFRFDRVFDTQVSQEEVFEHVAKDSIDSVLNGFNATIFAYGQTGSGKTFTITGGAERYADRGLIPRSIQYVFKKIKENPSRNFQCFISYLEIYNEIGYDLLDESRDIKKLEDLPFSA